MSQSIIMFSIKGWFFWALPSVASETSTMQSFIVISAILACSAAAPAYLLSEHADIYHVPLTSKSTYTQSSQVIDHGSTHVIHPINTYHSVPIAHAKTTITKADQVVSHGAYIHPVHSIMPVHEVYHIPKTTITKNSQVVNHGGSTLVHAPVVSVAHTPVVYHSSPLVTLKTGDSAVSHHSSTVHETVPLFAYHH